MVQTWSGWKRFPDAQSGNHVEAPIGPGVYEVRHTMTGRVIAFGHAGSVANALASLKLNGGLGVFARLLRKQPLVSRVSDLEYRTCAAGSRSEAKTTARRLLGLRQTAWRRRMDLGWAARHAG
jgi:Flp pilus assembly protein TadD